MISVISPISPVGFDDLRAVATFGLVEWGVVIGSSILVVMRAVGISMLVERGIVVGNSILVWVLDAGFSILVERGVVMDSSALVLVFAVATFSAVGWGEVFPRGRRVSGIAYGEG